jgi:hypothetical protein
MEGSGMVQGTTALPAAQRKHLSPAPRSDNGDLTSPSNDNALTDCTLTVLRTAPTAHETFNPDRSCKCLRKPDLTDNTVISALIERLEREEAAERDIEASPINLRALYVQLVSAAVREGYARLYTSSKYSADPGEVYATPCVSRMARSGRQKLAICTCRAHHVASPQCSSLTACVLLAELRSFL